MPFDETCWPMAVARCPNMADHSLAELESAIRASWSRWTSDPVDHALWSPECPARGQWAVTALVVQDVLGGELLVAEVARADGSRQGVHYWNRLLGGVQIDLTREQFTAGERVGRASVVRRPSDVTRGRLAGQYHVLSATVRRSLKGEDPRGPRPVSIKGVCVDSHGRVLLCRTRRGDYELPGGRPHGGELFPATLERELGEEAGLKTRVDRVLIVEGFEVLPGGWIDIVSYACDLDDAGAAPQVMSAEHTAVAFIEPASLPSMPRPAVYRRAIALAATA